jgi:protein ImuB
MTVACVQIPRFALRVAAGRSWQPERPSALAPVPGSRQVVGETSRPAEMLGVHAGMALGEALSRCPGLRLIAPDPARAAGLWEQVLRRLEGIGAAVESGREGEAFFTVDGLLGLHGGEIDGVLRVAGEAIGTRALLAAAPTRLAAALAAGRGRQLPRPATGSSEAVIGERALAAFLRAHPVSALRGRLEPGRAEDELIGALERLGIGTLGRLAELTDDQAADRFGALGLRALRLARGEDELLRPRSPREELASELELPEGTAGAQLERALGLLVDRLLAVPARRGRTLLAVRLGAPLCGGGSWSEEQGFGRPTAAPATIRSLLAPRLETLPGPVAALWLWATALGPPAADQLELAIGGEDNRRRRLSAAVREVRAAAGADALLRVVDLDTRSRVPERRFMLSPYPER